MRDIASILRNFTEPAFASLEEEENSTGMANTVDATIASKVQEIKSQPYAKYVYSEDVIERNFGYKIVRQQISSGRHSVIYKCESLKRQDLYCLVKAYRLGKDKIKSSLHEETVQIMRFVSWKCPQILSTADAFYTNEKIYLMCDWSPKGEVLPNLRSGTLRLNEEMLRNWTLDILNAVNFLHGNAICHRNIAPNCLLLTPEMRIKIGSLSDAVVYCKPDGTLIKQKWSKFSRSANWNQGPEVAKNKLYDPRRSDVWSIGATIYWFITKSYPIDYRKSTKMTKQLEHRMKLMHKVSEKCMNFVKRMLTFQPHDRPTMAQAMQLEWISTVPTSPTLKKERSTSVKAETTAVEISTPERQEDPGEAAGPEEAEGETSTSKKEQPAEENPQE